MFQNFALTFWKYYLGKYYHSPQRSSFQLSFVHYCVFLIFQCLLISWEPLNCFLLFFYKCSEHYLEKGHLNKETILLHVSLLGAILRYFGACFGVCTSIFESRSPSYLNKSYTDVSCINHKVSVLRKIPQHLSLCWRALSNLSEPILSILHNVLRNVKICLGIFLECLDITLAVTKVKNILGLPLLWKFFSFLVYFVLFPSNSREPSQIYIKIFVDLSF